MAFCFKVWVSRQSDWTSCLSAAMPVTFESNKNNNNSNNNNNNNNNNKIILVQVAWEMNEWFVS